MARFPVAVLIAGLALAGPSHAQEREAGPAPRDADATSPPATGEGGGDAAAASDEDATFEAARAAFEEGTEHAGKERWREAREAFERSHALRPHPLVAYNIGFCERALGRYTRSRFRLREALALEASGRGRLSEAKREAIGQLLVELEEVILRVAVRIDPPSSAVKVDGRPLVFEGDAEPPLAVAGIAEPGPAEPIVAGAFTLLLDPGPHVIIASYGDRPPAVIERRFDGLATEPLVILVPEPPPPPPALPPPPPMILVRPAEEAPWTSLDVAGLSLLGVGGAAGVIAAVTGGLALRADGDLADQCLGTACPPAAQDGLDERNRLATAATVTTVIGGLAAATGLTLLLWPGDDSAAMALRVAPGGVGLWWRF